MKQTMLLLFACGLALTSVLLVAGCDGWPGGDNPGETDPVPQTRILRVEVEPDTVVVGDTARFTCVIADSTDERFVFKWFFGAGPPTAPTEDNTVLWKAPDEPKTYRHSVNVDNGTRGAPPSRQFRVTVVE